MTGRPTVAAFDFDGTLTDRDSVVPFLRSLAGTRRIALGLARSPRRLVSAALRRDRDRVKELASEVVFAGRAVIDVERAADRYGSELVTDRLRADTLARLRWHQQAGHLVVIVSASYELYLREVVRSLGVDGLCATRLESDGGVFTGRLDGPNCRAAEKVRRLHGWMADRALDPVASTLVAYGDSAGDRAMLAAADHAYWVDTPLDSVAPAV